MKHYRVEDIDSWVKKVRAGEQILLSGVIYTARDAAHKRIVAAMKRGEAAPFPLGETAVYYAGPTPSKSGMPVGSCGPTTSSRMDPYVPYLSAAGLKCTIGKGNRAPEVYDALKEHGCIYLCAIGGAGALCAKSIKEVTVVAYPELGCESVKRMVIEDFPLFVGIDSLGNSIFAGEQA